MSATSDPVRFLDLPPPGEDRDRILTEGEWLVTNGLGGFASGTLAGVVTRRYHGMLVAALPAPLGRMVMLNHLTEQLQRADGTHVTLSGENANVAAGRALESFRLELGLPVWRYRIDGIVLEKLVYCTHLQNTVYVTYRLLEAPGPVRLFLRPAVCFRRQDDPVQGPPGRHYALKACGGRFEIAADPAPSTMPALKLMLDDRATTLTVDSGSRREVFYRREAERGYESIGSLWSPGFFTLDLVPGGAASLVASAEPWHNVLALTPRDALTYEQERRRRLIATADASIRGDGHGADLVLAADAFVIVPAGRVADATRARAAGDDVRTVIAGYHWFTDWGRDTMISLEGLALVTGRHTEAAWILRTFGHYVRDGLIPNMFPEGSNEGVYHTADATLWFFHALSRYLSWTNDRATIRAMLPTLVGIVDHHLHGTRFCIGVDPADGLLRQGLAGYQLTWMDAKVGDWVVTPRRGKAVEINALWYNALKLLEGWLRDDGQGARADELDAHAARARVSFNQRFWYEDGGYLFDVVDGEDGDDAACRPNQIFALSLDHAVLDQDRWSPVVEAVRQRLLTPVGLRTLAPDHPDYKPKYFGDLRARDAAYHQGTVWPWLLGPFIDAWLRQTPGDTAGARRLVEGLVPSLGSAVFGSIAEIFDAEPPFMPRGCVAQAWSVAELLRIWWKTSP